MRAPGLERKSKIMNQVEKNEWHFDFGLCATRPDQTVSSAQCEELLSLIVQWAERNNLGVGGGFREYDENGN
jgi:hypothetical protein